MSETILSVKNLQVSFQTFDGKVQAVRGIDFDLKKGETLVVQGIRKKIRFVRFKDQDFWEILSDKLVKKI